MQPIMRPNGLRWLLTGILLCAAGSCWAANIESGQWFSTDISTNNLRDVYEFQAYSNDTVLV
ncbi:MAG: hypothetical protein HYV36_06270, partial [Lentisphaerae bacterium]|nr:hypothetical protein [Lentisphaerota bacterium]